MTPRSLPRSFPHSLRHVVATAALALAGGITLVAAPTAAQAQGHGAHGGPGGHAGMMAGGHEGHGGMGLMGGPRQMARMLDAVEATPEQRQQIRGILDAARRDLQAQRESGKALRDQARQVFTQPNVDANAAEALRQQMLARHDQSSRRMMQAMLEVSRVLTPEQRQKLGQRMDRAREMMQRHRAERESLQRP
jgi:protein CpxP